MTETTHAVGPVDQLPEIRSRLGELVKIRLKDGFTEDEFAEYHRLVDLEASLLL